MSKIMSPIVASRVDVVLQALEESKAQEEKIINLENRGLMADAIVIVHGTSNIHMQSIAKKLEEKLKDKNITFISEGLNSDTWVLVDCGDIVIHIFSEESRKYYSLDKLWEDV